MITTETPGLAAERAERILALLNVRRVMRVDELSAELCVSAATVRRDLAELGAHGQIRRVHGGAVAVEGRLDEPVFDDKAGIAAREKQRIAECALAFVKPNDSVYLDGGSTVLALARLLVDMNGVSVVTNSLRVAGTLSISGPRLILVGGELRRLSQTFVGSLTEPLIDKLRVDRAFMGTMGLSPKEGLSTTDPREAYTKRLVMSHAQQVILLTDSSKFGTVSFVKSGAVGDLDVVITDSAAPKRAVTDLRKKGINVMLAEAGGTPAPHDQRAGPAQPRTG